MGAAEARRPRHHGRQGRRRRQDRAADSDNCREAWICIQAIRSGEQAGWLRRRGVASPEERQGRQHGPYGHGDAEQLLHDASASTGPRRGHLHLRTDCSPGGRHLPALGARGQRYREHRPVRGGGQGEGQRLDHGRYWQGPGRSVAYRVPEPRLRSRHEVRAVQGRRPGGQGAGRGSIATRRSTTRPSSSASTRPEIRDQSPPLLRSVSSCFRMHRPLASWATNSSTSCSAASSVRPA